MQQFTVQHRLKAHQLNNNYDQNLEASLKKRFENRCHPAPFNCFIRNNSVKFVERSPGYMDDNSFTGDIIYDIVFSCQAFTPVKGMLFQGIVTDKTDTGLLIDSWSLPVKVMVPQSFMTDSSASVNVDQSVVVEIVGSKLNPPKNGTSASFWVIGKIKQSDTHKSFTVQSKVIGSLTGLQVGTLEVPELPSAIVDMQEDIDGLESDIQKFVARYGSSSRNVFKEKLFSYKYSTALNNPYELLSPDPGYYKLSGDFKPIIYHIVKSIAEKNTNNDLITGVMYDIDDGTISSALEKGYDEIENFEEGEDLSDFDVDGLMVINAEEDKDKLITGLFHGLTIEPASIVAVIDYQLLKDKLVQEAIIIAGNIYGTVNIIKHPLSNPTDGLVLLECIDRKEDASEDLIKQIGDLLTQYTEYEPTGAGAGAGSTGAGAGAGAGGSEIVSFGAAIDPGTHDKLSMIYKVINNNVKQSIRGAIRSSQNMLDMARSHIAASDDEILESIKNNIISIVRTQCENSDQDADTVLTTYFTGLIE